MKKKIVAGILAVTVIAATICGCSAKKETTQMVNPVVEVEDMSEFDKQLGLSFNPDYLFEDSSFSIIDGKTAQVDFTVQNVDGEDVACTLRATKDAETAKSLSGIYDSDMTEPIVSDQVYGTETITISFQQANTEKYDIYTWEFNKVYYSFTAKSSLSQMELAEIMDNNMFLTGIWTLN